MRYYLYCDKQEDRHAARKDQMIRTDHIFDDRSYLKSAYNPFRWMAKIAFKPRPYLRINFRAAVNQYIWIACSVDTVTPNLMSFSRYWQLQFKSVEARYVDSLIYIGSHQVRRSARS